MAKRKGRILKKALKPPKTCNISLEKLPLEILNEICSYFRSPVDVLSLLSTCKALSSALGSGNGQLWYRFFDNREEERLVHEKYKGYTDEDLRFLSGVVPVHLNPTAQQYSHLLNGEQDFYNDFEDAVLIRNDMYSFMDAILYSLEVGGFGERFDLLNFRPQARYAKYVASIDYKAEAVRVLRGDGEDGCCESCMKYPASLFPESWNMKLVFCDPETQRQSSKTLCKDCIASNLIFAPNGNLSGISLAKARGRSTLPTDYFQAEDFLGLLISFRPDFENDPFANDGSEDLAAFKKMVTGPVDFETTIRSLSIYQHFFGLEDRYFGPVSPKTGDRLGGFLGIKEDFHGMRFLLRSDLDSTLKNGGKSLQQAEHHKQQQLKAYRLLLDIIYTKARTESDQSFRDGVYAVHLALASEDTLKEYLASEWTKFTSPWYVNKPEGIKTTNFYEPILEDTCAYHRNTKAENIGNTYFSIFDTIPGPPGDPESAQATAWISQSIKTICAKFLVLPRYPSRGVETKLNYIHFWIWERSARKFSVRQSKRAGRCALCKHDDKLYTPYYYAIHMYREHYDHAEKSHRFNWRPVKRGDTDGSAKVTKLTRANSKMEAEWGPYCAWRRQNNQIELGEWCFYDFE